MNNRIKSKGEPILSGVQALVLFSGIFALQLVLGVKFQIATMLVWFFVFVKRTLIVDVAQRSFKDGPLSKWTKLSDGGYISILQKVNQKTKKLDSDNLKLLWVSEGKTSHIYSPKDKEDAETVAIYLADAWYIGIYDAKSKAWVRDRG